MNNEHDIAYKLERNAEEILGYDFDHSGTFFDRDVIHMRTFYDTMYFLLHIKGKEGSLEFLNRIYDECKGKNMDKIKEFETIYNEFLTYLDLEK